MLYLAFKILTSKTSTDPDEKYNKNLFTVGILLQFINPKGILFGLTVVSTFILLITIHIQVIYFFIISRCSWIHEYM